MTWRTQADMAGEHHPGLGRSLESLERFRARCTVGSRWSRTAPTA
jgi:hypothetical protein